MTSESPDHEALSGRAFRIPFGCGSLFLVSDRHDEALDGIDLFDQLIGALENQWGQIFILDFALPVW